MITQFQYLLNFKTKKGMERTKAILEVKPRLRFLNGECAILM